jgi:hypothetical protein
MGALKACLWIVAVGCLLSVVGLFLPLATLESVAAWFGNMSFPDSPLVRYAVRVISATYVAIGVFYLVLALDPLRYGLLVPFSGAAGVFVGAVCGVTGFTSGMPPGWFLGDALFCTVLGLLILVFWRRAAARAGAR